MFWLYTLIWWLSGISGFIFYTWYCSNEDIDLYLLAWSLFWGWGGLIYWVFIIPIHFLRRGIKWDKKILLSPRHRKELMDEKLKIL